MNCLNVDLFKLNYLQSICIFLPQGCFVLCLLLTRSHLYCGNSRSVLLSVRRSRMTHMVCLFEEWSNFNCIASVLITCWILRE